MSPIEQFKKNLQRNAKTQGGIFHRTDFHVHLPGVDDYEYKADDCYEKLADAIRTIGLRLAVILRHEVFPTKSELEKLQKLCPNTVLIPGAEINVFVDVMDRKVEKDHYFHCIVAADPDSDWGYLMHKAKEKFDFRGTAYPSGFYSSIGDIARFFTSEGALFIPAHLHQNKSPDTSRSIDDVYGDEAFLSFVESGVFSALEVRKPDTAAFFDGTKSTKEGKPIPAAVCVRSSDAHSHEHMLECDRSTWVQMQTPSFAELHSSLNFRHRVRLEDPKYAHSYIVGVHVVGNFITDDWVAFSPSINCLIGCKGSGKTSILEALRFVLNTDIPTDRRESVEKHIDHILGASGYVECLVRNSDGEELLFVRRADSPNRISVTGSDGISREINASDQNEFDVAILGWHEIEAVADHASARVRLLDRIDGEQEIATQYRIIDSHVDAARDLLPALQRKIKNLDKALQSLWRLQKKRRLLKKLEDDSMLQLQTRYETYLATEQELVTLAGQMQSAQEKSERANSRAFSFLQSACEIVEDDDAAVTTARRLASETTIELKNAVAASSENVQSATHSAKTRIEGAIANVRAAFASFRQQEYEPRVKQLPAEEKEILTRQIQIIEETKELPQANATCQTLQSEVQRMAGEMHVLCNSICEARQRVCHIRVENIRLLNIDLENIQLHFNRSADHAKRDRFQKKHRDDASKLFGYVDGFKGEEPYEKLRTLFSQLMQLQVEEESWEQREMFWDARMVDLLSVVDDDDVSISMRVGEAGFVPIQNLSAGQRCTAVFPLLLRNTRGPLVIDQPEDNLDNRYIADIIAPDLLIKKRFQQFIATSHNANLVVLTDSDLIVHADSDGRTGQFVNRGFFGCSGNDIGQSVLDVLDGGEQALLARQRKYGTKA